LALAGDGHRRQSGAGGAGPRLLGLIGLSQERRRIGRRGRIGVVQPAPGVVLEHEWPPHLPAEVIAPVGRIRLTGGTTQDFDAASALAPDAARDLASAGADVVAYACSVGSLYAGIDAEAGLARRLADASGRPAVSLSAASMQALQALYAQNVAVITPYPAATNAWVQAYVEAWGLQVVSLHAFPVGLAEVGDLQPAEVAEVCVAALCASPAADALWIPCTAVQTLGAIPAIEARAGRPAVSGSQALLWAALRALGLPDAPAAGRLFTL
jgi:maleate isomerase